MADGRPDPIRIDVGALVQRSVASLYAHLVTRPTGRAVRLAIETQLAEAGEPTVSLVDLTEVTILDFSCADEVVAKLLQRFLASDRPRNAFFVFRGVQVRHRDPMQAVLERQGLVAVAQRDDGEFELLGPATRGEHDAWSRVERAGRVARTDFESHFDGSGLREGVAGILHRRLVFETSAGDLVALSRLVHH
ncbi:MAG: hypothetical protein KJO11_06095 [Gemmatimonadetes bacterium]|nr:hypothetical protein [Gemmatimonadota bacterium]MBT8404359.1 hypothetical protein [Gemmatimonadota bacterium]NNK62132.1 hypothetical protein [Gemmatimonadota bacterium]